MAYVAGKESPTAADVKKILTSIDAEVDDAAVDSLVSALKGKDIAEVIAAGRETMKGMVMGRRSRRERCAPRTPASGTTWTCSRRTRAKIGWPRCWRAARRPTLSHCWTR